ncbi:terminase small subunit [Mucilaginibacter gracilis]|uniref:Terminase small subunit n=1 Tax=Mucilaginibacter gracilis TaxID=423350 RepID=A0A495IZP4_9SPHI|nr:terminase small subunit [Mucilaginibacter gracilis]RKR82180.1 terminase small subunit [Mucilaginibacter gracilis]
MESNITDDALTLQQQRFCDEYLVTFNAFRSAMLAGYSENTARKGELLHLPKVQDYLKAAMDKTKQRLQITHDMVLRELAKIAFANMGNFYDDQGVLKPMYELSDDDKAAISQYQILDAVDDYGYQVGKLSKIKLHNKLSALDKIARHLNFYGVKGSEDRGRKAEDGSLKVEDGNLRVEDGGQMAEGGSLKVEGGSLMAEGGSLKVGVLSEKFEDGDGDFEVDNGEVGSVNKEAELGSVKFEILTEKSGALNERVPYLDDIPKDICENRLFNKPILIPGIPHETPNMPEDLNGKLTKIVTLSPRVILEDSVIEY